MRPLLIALFLAPLLALAGCGGGNIGDLFSIFPKEAFEPPGQPGGPGTPPAPFTPRDIGGLAGGQGVTGTVRNIAVATVSGTTYAFLAAGPDGVHVVDVTRPDLINSTDYVTTIRNTVLTAPAAIAGGAVHDLAIVDNTFLVCVAVGTGSANAVTVFNLAALITAATSPSANLSAAFIPPAAGSEIAVPGDGGKGGGVSGSGGDFFVATGGMDLIQAMIDPSVPEWMEIGPLNLAAASPGNVTEVLVNQTSVVYASGRNASGAFGLFSASRPPLPPAATFTAVTGQFAGLINEVVTGPGSYPLDLAHNTLNLYVTGNAEVFVYNITSNPVAPALLSTVTNTGPQTIAVSAEGAAFALGTGSGLQIGTNAVGQARLTASVSFPGTFTIRGSAFRTTDEGGFVLVCAGTGGLRVVQTSQAQAR